MEVRAELDLQPPVAQVLDADLQVQRELRQVEAEAVRLHQVPVDLTTSQQRVGEIKAHTVRGNGGIVVCRHG